MYIDELFASLHACPSFKLTKIYKNPACHFRKTFPNTMLIQHASSTEWVLRHCPNLPKFTGISLKSAELNAYFIFKKRFWAPKRCLKLADVENYIKQETQTGFCQWQDDDFSTCPLFRYGLSHLDMVWPVPLGQFGLGLVKNEPVFSASNFRQPIQKFQKVF